jgi:chromate transporter
VSEAAAPRPGFGEALRIWLKIGCIGFGGPAGQIALMHRILVDERKWVDEPRFLHALNFCMLLPGPEAQKPATYVGWLLHGARGGLAAGILFVLPGALVMLGVSLLYVFGQGIPVVDGALFGIKAAVLALALVAAMLMFRLHRGLVEVVAIMAALGVAARVLLGA